MPKKKKTGIRKPKVKKAMPKVRAKKPKKPVAAVSGAGMSALGPMQPPKLGMK